MKYIIKATVITICLFLSTFFSFAQENVDWPFLEKYQHENNIIVQKEEFPDVIFIGNSITERWYKQRPEFFEDHNFLGRGIGGQTTPQMLIRFTPDVIDLRPKVVVILAGTNDIAGNTGFSSVKMITDNLDAMTQLAKAHGIKVILSSILPVKEYPWSPEADAVNMIAKVNIWMHEYAKANNLIYLDYFSKTVDEEYGMKTEYSGDGVHPNIEGYKIMEPQALRAINEALGKQKVK